MGGHRNRFFPCLLFTVLLLACPGIQRERMGRIKATVSFETGLKQPRAMDPATLSTASPILPSGGWTPLSYTLSGSGPGGAAFVEETQDGVFSIECVPGEWFLDACVISQDNIELARGGCSCILQPGKASRADIVLYPLEGTGELSVYVIKNLEMSAGARLVGQLRFIGLPGQQAAPHPPVIPIDQPASNNELLFPKLGAGYYLLSLELKTEDGFVSGGCAVAALVLAGYGSSGACSITMGLPVASIGMELYPKEPLAQALLSVEHSVPKGINALPMAVSRADTSPGDTVARTWYRNGREAGAAVPILEGPTLLPPNCFIYPPSSSGQEASISRIDFTEEANVSHRFGTSSQLLNSCSPTDGLPWKAMAVYDYRAAMGPSLCSKGGAENQGSGRLFRTRCAAASESGLIAVADFDADKYLHAFVAAYGSTLDASYSPGIQTVPASASWLRLWRSRIRADDPKSADHLAISKDGRFIAAAASQGGWIWLGRLGPDGGIVSTSYLSSSSGGDLGDFKYVKALCFSPSGDRLYAACSSSNKVYAFATLAGSLEYLHSKELKINEASSLPPADMILTASGLLAISATAASRIFILQDGADLEILYCLDNAGGNAGLYKPDALAVSSRGDSFYALCNKKTIVRFSKAYPASPYVQDSEIALSQGCEGARQMAAGGTGGVLSETLLVAGGGCLEFMDIAVDGSKTVSQLVYPGGTDPLGFADPASISYCRGAFLIAGGDTGTITVFGNTM